MGSNPLSNAWVATKAWVEQPFKQPMSLMELFLLVGLIMVFIILWTRILAHLSTRI